MEILKTQMMKKHLSIVFFSIILFSLLLYIILNQVTSSSLKREIAQRNQLVSKVIGSYFSSEIENVIKQLQTHTAYFSSNKENKMFYIQNMERLINSNPLYSSIYIFNEKKDIIVSIPPKKESEFDLTPIHDRLSWSQTYYITTLKSKNTRKQEIVITFPYINKNGEYEGGLLAVLNLNYISEKLRSFKVGEKGINIIIDKKGSIVAQSSDHILFHSFSNHPIGEMVQMDRSGIWEGKIINQTFLMAYRTIMLGDFGIVVGEPKEQILIPIDKMSTVFLHGLVISLLLLILLTFLGTIKILKPIFLLTKQAKEYNEHKRVNFISLRTHDELEELTQAMNQMAKKLVENEKFLLLILESVPFSVITIDKHAKIKMFNKGAEVLTLYKREEVIGKILFDLPLKEEGDTYISEKAFYEGTELYEAKTYILDKFQNKKDIVLNSSHMYSEKGDYLGTLWVVRDVTRIIEMENYIKQNERLATLGQLTAGIAHEIRNPLSIIQNAAEVIQLEVPTEEKPESIIYELSCDILETTERMNELLSNFLKLAKSEENILFEKIEIKLLILELFYLLKKKIQEENITFQINNLSQEVWVLGNKTKLSQVFLNIFINALQSFEHSSKNKKIIINIQDNDEYWIIEVQDNGKGIPSSTLEWVFHPFYTSKKNGTGLGLSISYEIVIQHGGNLEVKSKENEGTSLLIYLPKLEKEGIHP